MGDFVRPFKGDFIVGESFFRFSVAAIGERTGEFYFKISFEDFWSRRAVSMLN